MNMMNRSAPKPNPQGLRMAGTPPADERLVTPPQAALRAAPVRPGNSGTPQRASLPSANANRGDDIMAVIRQLSELLTKENLALKHHKTSDIKAFAERKEQLARLYQQHMNAIHRDPQAVKAWEPAKRNALAQAAIRLSELMSDNASLLKANITTINRFLKTVVDAVKERQEKQSASYSKQGALNGYTAVKRNLAVSFNQTM